MINEQCSTSGCSTPGCACKLYPRKCFSWSAVLVGAFVGTGLGFLLNLFSIAIGLSTFTTTQEGVTAFAVGGFIGFAIGTIASMFVAGMVAGYLGRTYCIKRNLGALYGFTAWCLALILSVMLAAPAAKFVASYSGFVTNHNVTIVRMVNKPAVVAVPVNQVDVEKAANDMGKAGLALFVLFFLGAFFSSVGGHCGMQCKKDEVCSTDYPKDK